MARLNKEQRFQNIHQQALTEFDRVQSSVRDERLQCLQDRRFYSIAGAQWEGPLGEQYENKPRFEVNKIHLSVIRIINEYRNNRIAVDFVSKDGDTDEKLAETCNGLYRADERDSGAEEAYDNAFEEAVGGGIGALALVVICVHHVLLPLLLQAVEQGKAEHLITHVRRFAFDVHKLVFVLYSAWFVWHLCRVQRSRGKDVRWPMELSMRMAPCPTTRSSSLRAPCATRSRSGDLASWPLRGGGSWQIAPEDCGRSSGSW